MSAGSYDCYSVSPLPTINAALICVIFALTATLVMNFPAVILPIFAVSRLPTSGPTADSLRSSCFPLSLLSQHPGKALHACCVRESGGSADALAQFPLFGFPLFATHPRPVGSPNLALDATRHSAALRSETALPFAAPHCCPLTAAKGSLGGQPDSFPPSLLSGRAALSGLLRSFSAAQVIGRFYKGGRYRLFAGFPAFVKAAAHSRVREGNLWPLTLNALRTRR